MKLIYQGKVRDVYQVNEDYLLLEATDRTSGFNKHICTIQNKGVLLNMMSAFWFEKTRDIIPNHLVHADGRYSVVKKCAPFKIEVVVRGYIAGNTDTSLWTHYKNGTRTYCGVKFPDGLVKNQKLKKPVVTPTTKDEHDRPIAPADIVKDGYMTQEQMDYVFKKALELYKFGYKYAEKRGLLLVDTKYEFGLDKDGRILLIDEVHTCDSSRYWQRDTYNQRLKEGKSPDKMDKDQVRDWVRARCDPYKDKIPTPPKGIRGMVFLSYSRFYMQLTGRDLTFQKKDPQDLLEIVRKKIEKGS